MSQGIFSTIVPSTTSGNQLATLLNDFKDAVVSGFSGTSRPSNLQAGGYWVDTTNNPTTWDYKIYDGVQDITVFTLNLTTGVASIASADTLFEIAKISADSIGPILRLLKERVANNGQTLTGDSVGEIHFLGTRDSGVNVAQARIKAISSDDVTASAQGAYLVFEVTSDSSASIAELMRLIDGKVGIGLTAPEETLHVKGSAIKAEYQADDAVGASVKVKKKRVATSGQVLSGDVVGELEFLSTDNSGVEVSAAKIQSVASENHTGSAHGTKVVIKNKKAGQTSFTDQVEIAENVTVKTNLIVDGDFTVSGTTTTLNTTNLDVEDANVTVNKNGNQASANASKSGFKVEMSDATHAQVGYDSTKASKFVVGEVGSEQEIITAGHTQTLTNKTLTAPVVNSPSIVTPSRSDIKQDTYANLVTYATTATNGQLVFATDAKKTYQIVDNALVEVGSAVGGINYISNHSFETDANGYVTYADAASAAPVDGIGGVANITFTRTTSSPLRGTASGLITKDAANRQGQGGSYPFTIDSADQAKVLRVSFDYSSSVNYVDGDIRVYIYDVTNSRLIEVVDRDVLANANGQYIGSFQSSPDSVSYRLIWHIASTNASAYTLEIDNISVGPQVLSSGAIVTDWVSPVTQVTSTMTNITWGSRYRRVGDTAEIQIRGTVNGAVGGVTTSLDITLPDGLVIDTTKLTGSTLAYLHPLSSSGNLEDNNLVTYYNIQAAYQSSTSVRLVFEATSNGQLNGVTSTLPVTLAANDVIRVTLRVPIAGWSSNMKISENLGNREVAARANSSGTQTISHNVYTKPNFTSVTGDTTSSFSLANDSFTVPESGLYDVSLTVNTVNPSPVGQYYSGIGVNTDTSFTVRLGSDYLSNANTQMQFGGATFLQLNKGDVVYPLVLNQSGSNATIENGSTRFTIAKRQSPQTLAGGEFIGFRAVNTSGLSIANATDTVITGWTKLWDTHNAFNATSGVFTIPETGYYVISQRFLLAGANTALGNRAFTRLALNGAPDDVISLSPTLGATGYNFFSMEGSLGKYLPKGTTISLFINQTSGASQLLDTSVNNNFLSVLKVG